MRREGEGGSERRKGRHVVVVVVVVADERQEVCECRPVQQVRSTPLGVRSGQDNTKIPTRHEFSPGLVKHPPFVDAASLLASFSASDLGVICLLENVMPRIWTAWSEGKGNS